MGFFNQLTEELKKKLFDAYKTMEGLKKILVLLTISTVQNC